MITLDAIPARSAHFRFQWESAQDCYVLLYPEGMIKLNGPAGEILAQVDGSRSVAAIVAELQRRFPDAESLQADVLEFLDDAMRKRWISV